MKEMPEGFKEKFEEYRSDGLRVLEGFWKVMYPYDDHNMWECPVCGKVEWGKSRPDKKYCSEKCGNLARQRKYLEKKK